MALSGFVVVLTVLILTSALLASSSTPFIVLHGKSPGSPFVFCFWVSTCLPRTRRSPNFWCWSNSNFWCWVQGIGDQCENQGVTEFTEFLSSWSGSQGHCMCVSYACSSYSLVIVSIFLDLVRTVHLFNREKVLSLFFVIDARTRPFTWLDTATICHPVQCLIWDLSCFSFGTTTMLWFCFQKIEVVHIGLQA